MNKVLTKGLNQRRKSHGLEDDYRNRGIGNPAWSHCVPADQKQKKEREVEKTMSNRCPKCGRFIPKGEPICDDCLETIGRIIQEEVFPDSEVVVIRPSKAVSEDSKERLLFMGGKADEKNNGTVPFDPDDEDDWEYDEEFDEDEYDDDFEDEDEFEEEDSSPFGEYLKDGVFVRLFIPGKKKVTIKVE